MPVSTAWILLLLALVGVAPESFPTSGSTSAPASGPTSAPVSYAEELPFLLFNGKILNDLAEPVAGAQIQFWQTDQDGNYNHPAAGAVTLDPNFQYFGTATSSEDGSFSFQTRRPGIYTARPVTHIHFKVWLNGVDILTSQFYFADENTSFSDLLQLELEEVTTGDGDSLVKTFSTNKTIVVDLGLGGDNGPFTPFQSSGPFYPLVDFFLLDSNMVNVTVLERPGTPAPSDSPSAAPSAAPSDSPSASPTTSGTDDSSLSYTTDGASDSSSSSALIDIGISLKFASFLFLLSFLW
jgi:protocatechuate 3,4-dioxygenase beta subunit